MRRAQSVRYNRPSSIALASDDLGILREGDESNEDVLRRQLLDKDRENDKLQTQIETLQASLAQRPPLETIQELEKEYKHLELLLQGTQRENERCMTELERSKNREKMLERELTKLAGENWQASLDITPSPIQVRSAFSTTLHPSRTATSSPGPPSVPSNEATLSHIEQVRLLILGMEQRLQVREEKLVKTVERAEREGGRFEEMRKEVMSL
jgi:hypothetical protein